MPPNEYVFLKKQRRPGEQDTTSDVFLLQNQGANFYPPEADFAEL